MSENCLKLQDGHSLVGGSSNAGRRILLAVPTCDYVCQRKARNGPMPDLVPFNAFNFRKGEHLENLNDTQDYNNYVCKSIKSEPWYFGKMKRVDVENNYYFGFASSFPPLYKHY